MFEFQCSQVLLERFLTNIVPHKRESYQNEADERECSLKCSHSGEVMLSAGLTRTRSGLIQEIGSFL